MKHVFKHNENITPELVAEILQRELPKSYEVTTSTKFGVGTVSAKKSSFATGVVLISHKPQKGQTWVETTGGVTRSPMSCVVQLILLCFLYIPLLLFQAYVENTMQKELDPIILRNKAWIGEPWGGG